LTSHLQTVCSSLLQVHKHLGRLEKRQNSHSQKIVLKLNASEFESKFSHETASLKGKVNNALENFETKVKKLEKETETSLKDFQSELDKTKEETLWKM